MRMDQWNFSVLVMDEAFDDFLPAYCILHAAFGDSLAIKSLLTKSKQKQSSPLISILYSRVSSLHETSY